MYRKDAARRMAIVREMGRRGQSVDEIAEAAGYAKTTVYTLLPMVGGQYDGVRAKPGRPPVPARMRDDYKFLTKKLRKAKLAAQALGLVP